jgi:hypothetical protein
MKKIILIFWMLITALINATGAASIGSSFGFGMIEMSVLFFLITVFNAVGIYFVLRLKIIEK